MINVLNYSHPLSVNAKQEIAETIGISVEEIVESKIDCQIDFEKDPHHQVDLLIRQGNEIMRNGFYTLIVPPALSWVAMIVDSGLETNGIISLKRDGFSWKIYEVFVNSTMRR